MACQFQATEPTNFLEIRSAESYGQDLIDYLPNGKPFEAKNIDSTNLRNVFLSIGDSVKRKAVNMNLIAVESDLSFTTLLLPEWEKFLGIADDCFPGTGDIETRRLHALLKYAGLNIHTPQDYIDLAECLGFTIQTHAGWDCARWPVTWPKCWFATEKDAKFTLVVDFESSVAGSAWPWNWSHPWSLQVNIVQCLFNKLKPANTEILYRFIL